MCDTLDPLIPSFSDHHECLDSQALLETPTGNSTCFPGLLSASSVHASPRLEIAPGVRPNCHTMTFPTSYALLRYQYLYFVPFRQVSKELALRYKGAMPPVETLQKGKQDHCPTTPARLQRQSLISINHTPPATLFPILPCLLRPPQNFRQHQDTTTLSNTGRTPC